MDRRNFIKASTLVAGSLTALPSLALGEKSKITLADLSEGDLFKFIDQNYFPDHLCQILSKTNTEIIFSDITKFIHTGNYVNITANLFHNIPCFQKVRNFYIEENFNKNCIFNKKISIIKPNEIETEFYKTNKNVNIVLNMPEIQDNAVSLLVNGTSFFILNGHNFILFSI